MCDIHSNRHLICTTFVKRIGKHEPDAWTFDFECVSGHLKEMDIQLILFFQVGILGTLFSRCPKHEFLQDDLPPNFSSLLTSVKRKEDIL